MTLEILDAAVPVDRARWLELWSDWPGREVHAHPTYVELFARDGVDRSMALAWSQGGASALLAVILRPISEEEWVNEDLSFWDLITPYGYGGPYTWGASEIDGSEFLKSVEAWARDERVVTGFLRLSLFQEQLLALPGARVERMTNVVRSLDLDDEALWSDYAHKVRKNVKRARKHELTVEFDESGAGLDDFLEIYLGTMERRDAGASFYFERGFFERLIDEISGGFVFVHVRAPDGLVISTELVLLSAHTGYSFLGGTRSEAFAMRPNDLLKHETIRWLRDAGKRSFVLGGGYGADDGIYRYKKAFAPHGDHTFSTQSLVLNRHAFDTLMSARSDWELAQGRTWSPAEGFFPPYRS